jgi:hypothetical protein
MKKYIFNRPGSCYSVINYSAEPDAILRENLYIGEKSGRMLQALYYPKCVNY